MRARATRGLLFLLVGLLSSACGGTTGEGLVDFKAAAAGSRDAESGQPLEFFNDRGWDIVLTKATLHVGAIYLDQSRPVSGVQATSCILPGTYVAEVTEGRDVDLLSPALQRFPALGHGTTLDALVGQVWLTHGDVNQITDTDPGPILDLDGTATLKDDVREFRGKITIGSNRQDAGGLAGASPICKERIVSPIFTRVALERTGGLLLRIDASQLFINVDFSALPKLGNGYAFSDSRSSSDQPSVNLYSNLRSGGSLYTFSWEPIL